MGHMSTKLESGHMTIKLEKVDFYSSTSMSVDAKGSGVSEPFLCKDTAFAKSWRKGV